MANLNIRLESDSERFWEAHLDGNHAEYVHGKNEDVYGSTEKLYEDGKAKRTPEEEALNDLYKRVSKKVEKGYAFVEGSLESLQDSVQAIKDRIEYEKEEAEEAKARAKAEAKEAKARAKAEAKAQKEAEAEADNADLQDQVEEDSKEDYPHAVGE